MYLIKTVEGDEKLKYRLLSLIEFTTEDIELKEPAEFLKMLNVISPALGIMSALSGRRLSM